MKYLISATSLLCMLMLYSCKEKPASKPSVLNRQLTLPTGTPVTTPANQALPGTTPIVANNSSGQLNPAHGQPGHRCDIAVGAPLPATSQVANAVTTSLNAQPIQPSIIPSATPANGLNPAHGQPGHRCDIAVGKPLSEARKTESTSAIPLKPAGN